MAQVTIDMCNHIIAAADKGERFPLTVNEMCQLAHVARTAMEEAAMERTRQAMWNDMDRGTFSLGDLS